MPLADDLLAYFNTNWNATNCTKPTLQNGKQQQSTKDDYVMYFTDDRAEVEMKAFNKAKLVNTPFAIAGKAPDNTNSLKMIQECYRLLDAFSTALTGAWLEYETTENPELQKLDTIEITGKKIAWVAAATW